VDGDVVLHGRLVALDVITGENNVWMVENF
jgi:hypothetical protein